MINIRVFASGSSGNLYVVENEKTKILLECGVEENDLQKALGYKYNLGAMNGCIITHSHHDHYGCYRYVNKFLPIYSTKQLYEKKAFKGVIVEDEKNYKIGNIKFKAIRVNHGGTENYAYIFKDNDSIILFATDLASFNGKELFNFAFTEIYIEINYIYDILNKLREETENVGEKIKYERQINTHMELNNAIKFLSEFNLSKCKKINVIHISKDCGDRKIFKKEIEKNFGIECETYSGWCNKCI